MEENQKQQIVERLKQANNILVTVRSNPSVDQLSACIGLTILLNKLNKHATAVFSGKVPSTMEFLQPEKTIEATTDSLRDFIIALDKSKADKLRYKVENDVVRIFITPFRTSLSEKDFEFSQGDFNVDAVVALGVQEREDLDQAITAHGRILHDATVITINNAQNPGSLGAINWQDNTASSLSEMLVNIAADMGNNILDEQMSTAFLTGIVAETDRFSNEKTTPRVMTMSAQLMATGANQQLIANKLEDSHDLRHPENEEGGDSDHPEGQDGPGQSKPKPDGELDIDHSPEEPHHNNPSASDSELPAPQDQADGGPALDYQLHEDDPAKRPLINEIHIDDQGNPRYLSEEDEPKVPGNMTPPSMTGQMTANSSHEELEESTDPLSQSSSSDTAQHTPLLSHDGSVFASNNPAPSLQPPAGPPPTPAPDTMAGSPVAVPEQTPEQPASQPEIAADVQPVAASTPVDTPPAPNVPFHDDETLLEIERAVGAHHMNSPTDDSSTAAGQIITPDPSASIPANSEGLIPPPSVDSILATVGAEPVEQPAPGGESTMPAATVIEAPASEVTGANEDSARDSVNSALNSVPGPLEPTQALNSVTLGSGLNSGVADQVPPPPASTFAPDPGTPAYQPDIMSGVVAPEPTDQPTIDSSLSLPPTSEPAPVLQIPAEPSTAPPVPPPMYSPPSSNQ